ncbi:MAG: hypothetical protein UZ12_BCD005000838 [Bacteroidetes bacterium OLB12]|nr:MAG: hypothetical protein UZ12_BCD005000838 [Bacteroidetes bacterium OLB12]
MYSNIGLCPHRPKPTTRKHKSITTMTQSELKYGSRKSEMILNEVYFWTDTIKNWNKLLEHDSNKHIIIELLEKSYQPRKDQVVCICHYA